MGSVSVVPHEPREEVTVELKRRETRRESVPHSTPRTAKGWVKKLNGERVNL